MPRSTALGACLGTVDSNTLLCASRPLAAAQGTVMVRSVGTYPMRGASTLARVLFCGQLSCAVSWRTGSSGVATASSAPRNPVTMASSRALRYSPSPFPATFSVALPAVLSPLRASGSSVVTEEDVSWRATSPLRDER
ncbi:Uncharacterised protein [Mycobacteroides abscessus subsp. abscessus]|nr:Uncharacterised protein [Mycobacteroides abscessus subsp. abscessus]